MEKWIVGISNKQTVDCIVNYEVIEIHKETQNLSTRHVRNITNLLRLLLLHTLIYFTELAEFVVK